MRTTRRGRPKTKRRAPIILPGIEVSRQLYEVDKNPIHVWRAIHECLVLKRPLPSWVLAYLAPVAATFWSWSTRSKHLGGGVPVPRDLDAAIAKALGMRQRGAGNVFRKYNETKGLKLAAAVLGEIDYNNVKLYIAWEYVAQKFGVPPSTVRNHWNKYKHLFGLPSTPSGPKPQDK